MLRKVLPVFIASPSDLSEERRGAKKVVDQFNSTLGERFNLTVDLLGWEDTLPGAGRPQELINPEVEKCEVFIGLLWRRWGSPTGNFSSGFEEEFTLAMERYGKTGFPKIWLSFKAVNPEMEQDPGEQLRKVLEFKEERIFARDCLFKEFNRTSDWELQLFGWLAEYGARSVSEVDDTASEVGNVASPINISPDSGQAVGQDHPAEIGPLVDQLGELAALMANSVQKGDLEFRPTELNELQGVHVARLFLFAANSMSRQFTSEGLGAHEINVIYRHWEFIQATPGELVLLFNTIVSNRDTVCPGWYWFKDWNSEKTSTILALAASGATNNRVRERAIETLRTVKAIPNQLERETPNVLADMLRSNDEAVIRAALSYLGALGDVENLQLVESIVTDGGQQAGAALQAKMAILSRSAPNEALSLILGNPNSPSKEIMHELASRLEELDSELLTKCTRHEDQGLRFFAVNILVQQNMLPVDAALEIVGDNEADINTKGVCYRFLIDSGRTFSPSQVADSLDNSAPSLFPLSPYAPPQNIQKDDVLLMVYRSKNFDELNSMVDWYSSQGEIAYEALMIDHHDSMLDQIRSDLSDRFESTKQATIAKHVAELGPDAATYVEQFERFDDFIRSRFTSVAVRGLAEHGEAQDIDLCTPFLTEEFDNPVWHDARLAALNFLETHGSTSDTEAVLRISRSNNEDLKKSASRVALKLFPGANGAAAELLQTNDQVIVGLAVESLMDYELDEIRPILEPLLNNTIGQIRLKALTYFVKKLSHDDLAGLMSECLARPTYFYNVICWLDRILYAPLPLRPAYEAQLESMVP